MTRSSWLVGGVLVALAGAVVALDRCADPPARAEERREATTDAASVRELLTTLEARRDTVRTTRRTDRHPDGREVVTETEERTQATSAARGEERAAAEVRQVVSESREVERRASWRLQLGAGYLVTDLRANAAAALGGVPPVMRVDVSRRLVGPVWLGAFGERVRSDYAAGLSLAVEW